LKKCLHAGCIRIRIRVRGLVLVYVTYNIDGKVNPATIFLGVVHQLRDLMTGI